MPILKCKMCGGDIVLDEEKSIYTCEFCGTSMTLPKVSDEQKAALYNRGNHFRRIGEFDKALAIYENIVREDNTDAEAHWCCVLCRFGIEYVEDPATFEFLPTCHRASFDSILEDVDYLAALEYSDGITKRQYQKEAIKISEVQKGILATSQNEEPFDVFICYKETDDYSKERTRDSVDAQEIYYQLTQEGYRVFFSRITLEDKAGTEFEPYIFAALNSAKVMIVVGSKTEYFTAVWVKNEWSRFISLMKKDRKKLLIPCYHGMDPYDLPEQLSILQSYDMSKIGFIQDLIRGVKKVVGTNEPQTTAKETVVVNTGNTNVEPLLRRAFLFLEDEEWQKADEFCEQVLNQEPENAQAYIGKLMAELRVRSQEELANCVEPFDRSNNYQKAVRFGDDGTVEKLKGYIIAINQKKENSRKDAIYDKAIQMMNEAEDDTQYQEAAAVFRSIPGHRDADICAKDCLEYAEACRKDDIYFKANVLMNSGKIDDYESAIALFQTIEGWKDSNEDIRICQNRIDEFYDSTYHQAKDMMYEANSELRYKDAARRFQTISGYMDSDALATQCFEYAEIARKDEIYNKGISQMEGEDEEKYQTAIKTFQSIQSWKDTDDKIKLCENKIDEIKKKRELELQEYKRNQKKRKTRKLIIVIAGVVFCAFIVSMIVIINNIRCENSYKHGTELLSSGTYDEAQTVFTQLGNYKDSSTKKNEAIYRKAEVLFDNGEYDKAISEWSKIKEFSDSKDRINDCKSEPDYQEALSKIESQKYSEAIEILSKLGKYRDSSEKKEECQTMLMEEQYQTAINLMNSKKYQEASEEFEEIKKYKDANEMVKECKYQIAIGFLDEMKYKEAISLLSEIKNYKNTNDLIKSSSYDLGCSLYEKKNYKSAVAAFNDAQDYNDANQKKLEAEYAYVMENQDILDNNTPKYIQDLVDNNYPGANAVYQKLIAWKAEISISPSISLSGSKDNECYVNIKVTGLDPEKQVGDDIGKEIQARFIYPNGQESHTEYEPVRNGGANYSWSVYPNSKGTLTVKVYDNQDNLLGSTSIRL